MSLGITNELSIVGKVMIMILMFIGRVGFISFLFTLGGKTNKQIIIIRKNVSLLDNQNYASAKEASPFEYGTAFLLVYN